jgi:hypothetical protein
MGNGDGSFQRRREFPAGPYPTSFALGDFDSDGVVDADVVGSSAGEIVVLLGNGDGSLRHGGVILGSGITKWIGAGDWNGDGKIDLAGMYESGNSVNLLMNRDGVQFESAGRYGTGTAPTHGLVTDLNGDGHSDIASADFEGHSVTVLVGVPPSGSLVSRPPLRWPALPGGRGGPLSAEALVEAPAPMTVALSGLLAESAGAREVAFTLATTEPARLEVYDLAGRRMLLRDFRGVGPGRYRVGVPEAAGWRAGIYFARLAQGASSARAKWCLLR